MPTVLRIGSYRFHFYSDEGTEPPHIHVRTPKGECKFWLNGVRLARSRGIRPNELRDIERLVYEHHDLFLEKYHGIHGQS